MPIKNTQRRAAFIWIFIAFAGVFMVFMPAIFDIDIMNGGGALIFFGIFVFISGIIVSIMFFRRSKIFDNALRGEVLVRWNYDTDTWKRFVQQDYEFRKGKSKSLFILISSICFVVGLIFFILDPEAGFYVFLTMLGMIVILAITAYLSAVVPYRRNKSRVGEVIIFSDGIYINGATHIWKGFTVRLESVSYSIDSENCVEFIYSAVTRTGRECYTVLVPIPQGREKEAVYIVGYFNSQNTRVNL